MKLRRVRATCVRRCACIVEWVVKNGARSMNLFSIFFRAHCDRPCTLADAKIRGSSFVIYKSFSGILWKCSGLVIELFLSYDIVR